MNEVDPITLPVASIGFGERHRVFTPEQIKRGDSLYLIPPERFDDIELTVHEETYLEGLVAGKTRKDYPKLEEGGDFNVDSLVRDLRPKYGNKLSDEEKKEREIRRLMLYHFVLNGKVETDKILYLRVKSDLTEAREKVAKGLIWGYQSTYLAKVFGVVPQRVDNLRSEVLAIFGLRTIEELVIAAVNTGRKQLLREAKKPQL